MNYEYLLRSCETFSELSLVVPVVRNGSACLCFAVNVAAGVALIVVERDLPITAPQLSALERRQVLRHWRV